jgi:uncharacterized protein (DUF1778 family)
MDGENRGFSRAKRLPNDVHALLKHPAEIEGRTLTDFVVSAAREAACRTIEASEIIRLSVEDRRRTAEAHPAPYRAARFTLLVGAEKRTGGSFYQRFGLRTLASQPRTLFLPLATARKVFFAKERDERG